MNITKTLPLLMAIAAILGFSSLAYATDQVQVVTPPSGVLKPEDTGVRARTNYKLLVPSPGAPAKLNAGNDSNQHPRKKRTDRKGHCQQNQK